MKLIEGMTDEVYMKTLLKKLAPPLGESYLCIYVRIYLFMYLPMYVCMYVCRCQEKLYLV